MLTVDALIACGVEPTQAKAFAPHLAVACQRFNIANGPQKAAFVAQAMHESANFTRLEENLYYSTPERIRAVWPTRFSNLGEAAKVARNPKALALAVYSNRMGNADPSSGDGWAYRGRGLFHLTGLANYMAAGDALGQDYKVHPELVVMPEHAAITAGWFWAASGCNDLLGAAGFDATSKRINGGMHGARERRALYATCTEAIW